MNNMAAIPIFGEKLGKSASHEPLDGWPSVLVCSFGYTNTTTKVVQMMFLGWAWPVYSKIKDRKMLQQKISWKVLKNENDDFGKVKFAFLCFYIGKPLNIRVHGTCRRGWCKG